jgi:hypothetical protein
MENQAPQAQQKPSHEGHSEFVCNPDCCKQLTMNKPMMKIGKKWATALAGFIAGAAVAAIVLVPWMLFQGKLCDTKQTLPSATIDQPQSTLEEGAPAPAPAPVPGGEVMEAAPAPAMDAPAPTPAP